MSRRPSIPFTHGVHEDVCALVGERAALIFNRIAYYVEYNALAGEHFYDGQHFARVTVPDLLTVFHWLNKDKVTYAIKTLIQAGLLCVPVDENGKETNLSALGWRRGKWYGHGTKSPINPKVEKFTLEGEKTPPSKVEKFTLEGRKSSPAIGDTSSYTNTQATLPAREGNGDAPQWAIVRAACIDAAGEMIAATSRASIPISPVLAWINDTDSPCDLEMDVLPAIRSVGARASPPRNLTSFAYFRQPSIDLRDARLLPNPEPRQTNNEKRNRPTYDDKQASIVARRRERTTRVLARR